MTISKKTVLLSLVLLALIGAGVAMWNVWWLAASFLALLAYLAKKLWGIRQQFFGPPQGHALRRADLTDVTGPTLGHYYVHADGKNVATVAAGVYCQPPFDGQGIPLVDYGPDIGQRHNACTTAQYALENLELFLQTGRAEYRVEFLRQADWLVANLEDGRWFYRFDNPGRGLKNPWISAMAQGQGLSVLLRAWQASGDKRYLHAAESAFAIFEVPVDRGGVSLKTNDGTWFEEYPNAAAPDHVMNGHFWALFGIWDMYRATQNPTALHLFQKGIAVLKANLAKYDNGYWVVYDLRPKSFLVNSYYMHFQINQVRVLYAVTKDPLFAQVLARWEGYLRSVRSSCLVVIHSLGSRVWPDA